MGVRCETWIHLGNTPLMDVVVRIAEARGAPKAKFASTRLYTSGPHLIGAFAEMVYAIVTGQPFNEEIHHDRGDGGEDFPGGVDVKGCTYWENPYLKVDPNQSPWPKRFVLVSVDVDAWRGRVEGSVHESAMRQMPLRDWGYGPMLSMSRAALECWNREDPCLAEAPA